MMAPTQALELIYRVAAEGPLCTAPSQELVEFQTADAGSATPISVLPVRFGPPRETPGGGVVKSVCNRVRHLKRNRWQHAKAFRFAKCETAGDLLFPLLSLAIAKAHVALPQLALSASLIRARAKIHHFFGHAP